MGILFKMLTTIAGAMFLGATATTVASNVKENIGRKLLATTSVANNNQEEAEHNTAI
ncbi:MAG: hypothetical protein LBM93_11120 [Oscillospiraceae bacterium]|nr:hypothetical protein [Oscillospiraceae bacterium]